MASKLRISGAEQSQQLLGLQHYGTLSTDVVFVSLDLEVNECRQSLHLLHRKPRINQVGFVTLDSRDFQFLPPSADLRNRISVRWYQATDRRPKKEHPTISPIMTSQEEICAAIVTELHIHDDLTTGLDPRPLRNLVLVGHSIRNDLKVLQMLGLNLNKITPLTAILDTHKISRDLFPPYDRNLPTLPDQDFSLGGVLDEFNYPVNKSELHNAATDAAYTLYLVFLLAVKGGIACRDQMGISERENLAKFEQSVSLWTDKKSPPTLGAKLLESMNDIPNSENFDEETIKCLTKNTSAIVP